MRFDIAHIGKMDTPSTPPSSKTHSAQTVSWERGLGGVVNTNMHFLCEVAQNPSTLEGTHVMSTKIQSSKSHMTTWGQGCVVWTSPKHPIGNSKRWFQFLREKQPLSSVLLWKRNAANVKGILVEVGKYYERIGQIN